MTHIGTASRAGSRAPFFLALGAVGFISSPAAAAGDVPAAAAAAEPADGQPPQPGDPILVTGTREAEPASPHATSNLLDTPQTVTVIGQAQLQRQNLLTLRDALSTLPGITFGAGEGGQGYGDSINLRGYSANNDITQDGVRDSAQYSRTDPFNTQQIEVYNGANSAYNGSGSVGGTINLVSKVPLARDFTTVQAAVGTDNYYRATIDANRQLNGLIAVRLNAMYHRNDYPGRDDDNYRRWGIAPSITIGIGGPTSLTLAYVHQRDDNHPAYGVPYFLTQVNDGPLPGSDLSDDFGFRDFDNQLSVVDRLTATFDHRFGDHLSARNLTRWQRVGQDSVTTSPQGVFCLATTGRQPVAANFTDTIGLPCTNGLQPGQFLITGPHLRERIQENQLMYNQTDLRWEIGQAGGVHNILVVGGQLTWEGYRIDNVELARNPDGSAAPLAIDEIANPRAAYDGPVNPTLTARSISRSRDSAAYAFDTLELGRRFELNGGVRIERATANFRNVPLAFNPPGTAPLTPAQQAPQRSADTLFSYRVGLVFKPTAFTSLYAAYGNAKTPSSATVRLGCGTIPAPGAADPCAVAPETARNYEIGAKADLIERRLQITAALFRNERSNFRVPSNDPSLPTSLQVVDGRARVDGIALGATGNITRAWTIFANYTYLDSTVLQSVSDFCLANPGASCGNSTALPDPQRGDDLVQTPRHSGSLFTTYRLPFGLQIGYGFTYQGSFALNQRNIGFREQIRTDDYWVHRLFFSYELREGLTAQINIQNLTNTHYFTGIRHNVSATAISGGWALPGEARSAVLTLTCSL